MKASRCLFILILSTPGFLNAQMPLPKGVCYFPETLGPLADSSFYKGYLPFFSAVDMKADWGHQDKNLFVLTMSLFESKNVAIAEKCVKKTYPTQALILSANNTGVFPRWCMNFNDDTTETDANILGIFRYYPEYGVYAFTRNDYYRSFGDNLLILDSTFHAINVLPHSVNNGHDFQLSKTPDGKWQILSSRWRPQVNTGNFQIDYSIINTTYDHDTVQSRLWTCKTNKSNIDSAEWAMIFSHCDVQKKRDLNADNSLHPNSWQAFTWSPDSLLVAVSERNDDKVRFWWVVDSAGNWITGNSFRLGSHSDLFNDFSFPYDPEFQISGGHNFRILSRAGNSILASYFDDEQCSGKIPARGLILSLDLNKKICHILQQRTQGSYATGRGSMQIIGEDGEKITAQSLLKSNSCMAWGGWAPSPNSFAKGYYPCNDTIKKCWELSVLNPKNQTIVGITVADLGFYTHHIVLNNSEYQAEARYNLPIPRRPIKYTVAGNQVILKTDFVSPTWITGDTTDTIKISMPPNGQTLRIWVRGKTDRTMIGELWESIVVSGDMKKNEGK